MTTQADQVHAPPAFRPSGMIWVRALFIVSALWNLAGALPGLFDTAGMFANEFGRMLDDPVMVSIYRGAWGTAFLYGLGFLLVAANPLRHSGIVLMGGAGKALFAINLAYMHTNGWASDFAPVIIVGDGVFVALFIAYFAWLKGRGRSIL